MSNGMTALIIIFAFLAITTIIGIIPGMKQKLDLEGWAIGGRSFGRALNWFVLAGEIYTAFAFLGASGWAYTKGGPTFYIIAYSGLAYVISYFILPHISRIGHEHGFISQPDFIAHCYKSKNLGLLVAFIGIIFIIPYLQLQLTAVGIIIEACSFGAISSAGAMLIAFILVAGFVYVSGLKGVASTAVIKDIFMATAVLVLGIYLPTHYFGSVSNMLQTVATTKPDFLALPGGTKNMDVGWFMSTIALTCIGFYMWPHIFADSFSAKDPSVLRHNSVYLPLYGLCNVFPMLVGFTALLLIPDLQKGDMAFLALVAKTFPAWILGLIGGAGALAAMVPAADLLVASSVLISNNIYKQVIDSNATPTTIGRMSKALVIILTAISLVLAIFAPSMLVNLLLTGYAGITQLFPIVVLALFWKNASKTGAFCGLLAGEFFVFYFMLTKTDPFGLNSGFVALVINLVIMLVVSSLTSNKVVDNSAEINTSLTSARADK